MQRRVTLKQPLLLKRQITMNQSIKHQQWILPPQYHKLLLFLGILRKIIRSLTQTIKTKQDKQHKQIQKLKIYCNGQTNSFDWIQPINKNYQHIKFSKEVLVQMKKDIVNFLRNIRAEAIRKQNRKKSQTNTEIVLAVLQQNINNSNLLVGKPKIGTVVTSNNLQNQQISNTTNPIPEQTHKIQCQNKNNPSNCSNNNNNNNILNTTNTNINNKMKQQHIQITKTMNSTSIPNLNKPIININKNGRQIKKQLIKLTSNSSRKCKYDNLIKTTRNQSDSNQFIVNIKKLSTRVKNQSAVFQKLNKTLTNFCQTSIPNTNTHSNNPFSFSNSCSQSNMSSLPSSSKCKGYQQMLQLYIRSLLQIKNKISININNIINQKISIKQRIFFLIYSLNNLNQYILTMFNRIGDNIINVRNKIQELNQNRYIGINKSMEMDMDMGIGMKVGLIKGDRNRCSYINNKNNGSNNNIENSDYNVSRKQSTELLITNKNNRNSCIQYILVNNNNNNNTNSNCYSNNNNINCNKYNNNQINATQTHASTNPYPYQYQYQQTQQQLYKQKDITKFIYKIGYMIQISKIILAQGYSDHLHIGNNNNNNYNYNNYNKPTNTNTNTNTNTYKKNNSKFIPKMLTKLSQFRYIATYLITQVANSIIYAHHTYVNHNKTSNYINNTNTNNNTNKSTNTNNKKNYRYNHKTNYSADIQSNRYKQNITEESLVQQRWRKIYYKKYGKLNNNNNNKY